MRRLVLLFAALAAVGALTAALCTGENFPAVVSAPLLVLCLFEAVHTARMHRRWTAVLWSLAAANCLLFTVLVYLV